MLICLKEPPVLSNFHSLRESMHANAGIEYKVHLSMLKLDKPAYAFP